MSRLQKVFSQLRVQHKKALIPFFVGGDPSLAQTLTLMQTAVTAGADILEIGVPFSDPVADGPVIQASYTRAIAQHIDFKAIFRLIRDFRITNTQTPILLMTYLHPIEVMGHDTFVQLAKEADVDGILIVDLPADSEHALFKALLDEAIDPIFLLSPTTSSDRMKVIAEKGSGFLYYVSIKGITGTSRPQAEVVKEKIEQIRKVTSLPVVVGFGIHDAKAANAIAQVADGVVIGSALCTLIHEAGPDAIQKVHAFLTELRQYTGP